MTQKGKKEKRNVSNDSRKMPQNLPNSKPLPLLTHHLKKPMSKRKTDSATFVGGQRTNIRMSKLARSMQTSASKRNWSEMVKMLFRSDPAGGRKQELRKLVSLKAGPGLHDLASSSYSIDQVQYLLFLMLVISISEKRTQELYAKDFAQRCDAISKRYHLEDDQYWKDGTAPLEWNELSVEFEEHSLRILLQTLREYHQDDIAHLIESDGSEDFFQIINNIRAQFLLVLGNFDSGTSNPLSTQSGSLPETVQSSGKD
jgi:hypothetical protein